LVQSSADAPDGGIKIPKLTPKYLRVVVDTEHSWDNEDGVGRDKGPVHINVRVPVALIRAGVKLASLIPPEAYNQMDEKLKDRGIMFDLRNIKPENIDELIQALHELEVDIRGTEEKVRVYME
jgi:predicted TIM-barrel fold metal-dependent hydrolase